jgi:tetratricopeptide (TPR) repeat protein
LTAITYFKRALSIKNNMSYVYCLLGHEYLILEEYEMSRKCYEQAIDINKYEFYGFWGLGNVSLKTDQNKKA